jgi:adenylosuccinate lyase
VLDFMIADLTGIIEGLVVYPDRMLTNLNASGGVVFSQRVMLALVDAGMDRQAAYKLVQRHALASWDEGGSFHEAIASDPQVANLIRASELDMLFDPEEQLRHVNAAFERVGLGVPVTVGADR